MKLQESLSLVLASMVRITGEMAWIGFALVVPCFVMFLPGITARMSIQSLDTLISLMQLAGLCSLFATRTITLLEIIDGRISGWLGNALLTTTGVSLALEAIIRGKTSVRPAWFVWIWFFGEAAGWAYLLMKGIMEAPLHFNYGLNTICVAIVLIYYYKGQK